MSLLTIVLIAAGLILVYSAIQNENPKDVVLKALGQVKKNGN